MKKIAIIGAGGFGREVKMLIDQINNSSNSYDFIGYFDDNVAPGTMINNTKVLGGIDCISEYNSLFLAVAVGNPVVKEKIIARLNIDMNYFPPLIHPSVIMGKHVDIGLGTIICAGGIITENIVIGDFVILNIQCTVGHDTIVESFCSVMPGVNISGEVKLEKAVYIGTGAKIINQINIGTGSIIGAGAVVAKSIPANATAVGIPAKVIKINE